MNKEALRKELEDAFIKGFASKGRPLNESLNAFLTTRLAALDDGDDGVRFGEWQLCPKCGGHKQIPNPFIGTVTGPITIPCDICGGSGKLAKPIIK